MATTKKASKKKTTKKKRVSKKAIAAHLDLWNELRENVSDGNIVKYSMKEKFPVGVAIDHPKFGVGVVRLSLDKKIEVVFEEGVKDLVHQRES